ncbi:MAG: hypothetical protein V8S22_05200 [Lachnospiraceae bacterium]
MKADYLVEYRMYNNAIQEYATLLKNRNPGKMGVQFYAAVYANLASAYANFFSLKKRQTVSGNPMRPFVPTRSTGDIWQRSLCSFPGRITKNAWMS